MKHKYRQVRQYSPFFEEVLLSFLFVSEKAKEYVILKLGLSTTSVVDHYQHKKIKSFGAYDVTLKLHLFLAKGWLAMRLLKQNSDFIVFRRPIIFF